LLIRLVRFNPEETLLVKGPAKVVAEGEGVSALSKPLRVGECAFVQRGKIMPFESFRPTAVKLTLGESGADYTVSRGEVGTRIWRRVAERVFEAHCRRIVVVGATDSGKSTLTMYILNEALSRGMKTAVVDEDVGQGDIAPPGCIGGKILEDQAFDLRDMKADFFGFVGATSPRGVNRAVIGELRRVKNMVEDVGVDIYIVNTDGYVAYDGVDLKTETIREVNPDVVICFEERGGGRRVYERLRNACECSIIPARCSEYSVKSLQDRVRRRMSQYRRFLSTRQRLLVNLRDVSLTFLGRVYSSNLRSGEEAVIVKGGVEYNTLTVKADTSSWIGIIEGDVGVNVVFSVRALRGMFVGLGSDVGVAGFGLCGSLKPNLDLEVYTDFRGEVKSIYLSRIRLTKGLDREYIIPALRLQRGC